MLNSLSQKREQTLERMIARADRLLTRGQQVSRRFSQVRLGIVLVGFGVCLLLYKTAWFHAGNGTFALFLLAFLTTAHVHARLDQRLHRLQLWRRIKGTHLARLRLDWPAIPVPSFPNPSHHPYSLDLDLTGPHSLLHLLDVTVTQQGQDRLAAWLLNQNDPAFDHTALGDRQQLIQELAGALLLRDRLALEARLVSPEPLSGARIHALLDTPVGFSQLSLVLLTSSFLCALTIVLLIAWLAFTIPGYWVLSFGLYLAIYLFSAEATKPVFDHALGLHHELEQFAAVVHRLEKRSYTNQPHLHTLCAPFVSSHHPPSVMLKRLARLCYGLSVKAHPLVHLLLNVFFPWDLGLTYQVRRECQRLQHLLPDWLDCVATIDAAASLGNFAFLHPAYDWPTLLSAHDRNAGFQAKALGHPLLPAPTRVLNDITLQGIGRVMVVTGSNMSGKSTFLRTIGLNLCLAQAGAPVCAHAFTWTGMRVFCCIRVSDSLEEGISYFYAEVKRLKVMLDAIFDPSAFPVLYLIDEIFKGTNNRERLLGSEAYIRELKNGNGLGLITTHDLELAQLATEGSGISNVHFRETVEGDKLQFDYRLCPGPCPTTNALRIMEKEGLPVPQRKKQGKGTLTA